MLFFFEIVLAERSLPFIMLNDRLLQNDVKHSIFIVLFDDKILNVCYNNINRIMNGVVDG